VTSIVREEQISDMSYNVIDVSAPS